MAAAAMSAQPLRMASLLPQISAPALRSTRIFALYTRQITHNFLPALSFALPAVQLNIPAWLGGIWESILRAVPKKKTSHSKKRHRQMAGKALQEVKSLCKCPACGQTKRMHVVCPNCMTKIQEVWKKENRSGKFI